MHIETEQRVPILLFIVKIQSRLSKHSQKMDKQACIFYTIHENTKQGDQLHYVLSYVRRKTGNEQEAIWDLPQSEWKK